MVWLLMALLAEEPAAGAEPVDQATFEVWIGNAPAGREQFTVIATHGA